MSQLSCVQRHQAVIVDRGGSGKITQLQNLGEVKWSRELSNISRGSATLFGNECRFQESRVKLIEPRRHELVIFRNNQRVWEGPVTEVEYGLDHITIKAADGLEYLQGTPLTKYWANSEDGGTDNMMERVSDIIQHEMTMPYTAPVAGVPHTFQRWEQLSPPANILPFVEVRPSATLKTTGYTTPFEMTVAEHLVALSKIGLSFTMIGRKLLVWDSSEEIGRTRAMSQADFGASPSLYVTSAGFTAVQHVVGQPEPGQAPDEIIHVGSAGETNPYYGAWTLLETNAAEDDPEVDPVDALASQAASLYEERRVLPIEIGVKGGGSIRLDSYLTIDDLVPGVNVPVVAQMYGREVSRLQMFSKIEVTETASGETIGGTLVTAGGAGGGA